MRAGARGGRGPGTKLCLHGFKGAARSGRRAPERELALPELGGSPRSGRDLSPPRPRTWRTPLVQSVLLWSCPWTLPGPACDPASPGGLPPRPPRVTPRRLPAFSLTSQARGRAYVCAFRCSLILGFTDNPNSDLVFLSVLFSSINIHGNSRQIVAMIETCSRHSSNLPKSIVILINTLGCLPRGVRCWEVGLEGDEEVFGTSGLSLSGEAIPLGQIRSVPAG